MSVATEIAAALAEAEGAIPNTFTWSGSTYACSASAYTTTKTWTDEGGGADVLYDLSLTVRVATLNGANPAEGDTLTHRSKSFKIQKIIHDPSGAFRRLICLSNEEGI